MWDAEDLTARLGASCLLQLAFVFIRGWTHERKNRDIYSVYIIASFLFLTYICIYTQRRKYRNVLQQRVSSMNMPSQTAWSSELWLLKRSAQRIHLASRWLTSMITWEAAIWKLLSCFSTSTQFTDHVTGAVEWMYSWVGCVCALRAKLGSVPQFLQFPWVATQSGSFTFSQPLGTPPCPLPVLFQSILTTRPHDGFIRAVRPENIKDVKTIYFPWKKHFKMNEICNLLFWATSWWFSKISDENRIIDKRNLFVHDTP